MKILNRIALLLIVALTISCSPKEEHTAGVEWGYTEYFPSSVLKKYEPVRMTKTLKFDLNSDAADSLFRDNGYATFVVSNTSVADGDIVPATNVRVYQDGTLCPDGEIKVGKNSEVKVGLEFIESTPEGRHMLYLRYKDFYSEMEGSEYVKLNVEMAALEEGIVIIKKDVTNSANDLCFTLIGLIIIALLLWICVIRPIMHKGMSVSVINIIGEYQKVLPAKGRYKIILTNKPQKQSLLKRIFVGRIDYEVNACWTSEISFEHRNNKSVRIHLDPKGTFTCNEFSLERNGRYTLENTATKSKTTIQIM